MNSSGLKDSFTETVFFLILYWIVLCPVFKMKHFIFGIVVLFSLDHLAVFLTKSMPFSCAKKSAVNLECSKAHIISATKRKAQSLWRLLSSFLA
ncbi:hypothetical protein Lfee_2498 [Legionella feeleii]|uniref:Uncharacterized protein n=1 Tax=Legionella feeleii TaxID=453 RepID=A0A0W0TGW7_9GAMM|nr:hypothetical protein Lfee_2498 [Legionella feeleii]